MIYLIPFIWLVVFAAQLIAILLGFIVVPIGLLFKRDLGQPRDCRWEDWRLIQLPKCLWIWDNKRDGALGDTRGDYWDEYPHPICRTDFLKMYNWLALRNPINNFSRYTKIISCNLGNPDIKASLKEIVGCGHDVKNGAGHEGMEITYAKGLIPYVGFYYASKWSIRGKNLCIIVGSKIHYSHRLDTFDDEEVGWKGTTCRIGLKLLR